MNIQALKHELRLRDYFGCRWDVAMSAMFDICAIGYEELDHYTWNDVNVDWEYRVGAGGNEIKEDNMFLDMDLTSEEIVEIGNYLNRLTEMLRETEHAYF